VKKGRTPKMPLFYAPPQMLEYQLQKRQKRQHAQNDWVFRGKGGENQIKANISPSEGRLTIPTPKSTLSHKKPLWVFLPHTVKLKTTKQPHTPFSSNQVKWKPTKQPHTPFSSNQVKLKPTKPAGSALLPDFRNMVPHSIPITPPQVTPQVTPSSNPPSHPPSHPLKPKKPILSRF